MRLEQTTEDRLQQLVGWIAEHLADVGYYGPVCIAGGYVRDNILHYTPKDLDVFVDDFGLKSEMKRDMAAMITELLNNHLPRHFTAFSRITQTLKSYGTWASDVDIVHKISVGNTTLFDMLGLPTPLDIDLVFLERDAQVKAGYTPSRSAHLSFLSACMARVDIRLNALGVCPGHLASIPEVWYQDAANGRLVVQASRVEGDAIPTRIDSRLRKQLRSKFSGWTCWREQADGPDIPYDPFISEAHPSSE